MSAQGRLSLLKRGLECVRLEKSPYSVAWDVSGNHILTVWTVEEFIGEAEKGIKDTSLALAEQVMNKRTS
jgi:hypothetical protein